MLDQLDPAPGCRLLDAGCGYGNVYHAELARRGVRPVGLDQSLAMLREATENCERVQGDVAALPFLDAAFDRVMCNHVLYHVADRMRALRELRRVTRAGGRVVISTNAVSTMRTLWRLVDEAATEAGVPPPVRRPPFSLGSLDEVRSVFPDAIRRHRRNVLLFDEPEGAVAYVGSVVDDPAVLAALRRRLRAVIERRGEFRTETVAGCFVASV